MPKQTSNYGHGKQITSRRLMGVGWDKVHSLLCQEHIWCAWQSRKQVRGHIPENALKSPFCPRLISPQHVLAPQLAACPYSTAASEYWVPCNPLGNCGLGAVHGARSQQRPSQWRQRACIMHNPCAYLLLNKACCAERELPLEPQAPRWKKQQLTAA